MALQSSGAISLSDIQTEFGGSNPISLSEYYGSDTVPSSGAISIGDFYGTSSSLAINTSFTQCVDIQATLYYDGNGKVYVNSNHTGRGDCSGAAQGNQLRLSFNKTGFTTINIVVTSSGRNGTSSVTINQSVNSAWGWGNVGVHDGSGGAGVYNFTIIGTIT
jgi:hypothetical protein